MANIKEFWKQLADKKTIASNDVAVLCILKAFHQEDPELAKVYLSKSFKPITNTTKLANGAYPRYALWMALTSVPSSKLFAILTDEEKEKTKALATSLKGSYGEVKL